MLDLEKNFDLDSVVHFFSCQTELEKLGLFVWNGRHVKGKKLLLRILALNLPCLKELEFTFCCKEEDRYTDSFTVAEFSDFLMQKEKLESLSLSCKCGCFLKTDEVESFPVDKLPKTRRRLYF